MILVLDNLRSAQNVGSIIRTAEVFRVTNIILLGITPGPDNAKVLKTSLGAEKELSFTRYATSGLFLSSLKGKPLNLVSLEITKKATEIASVKSKDETVLVVGNEVSGVSEDIILSSNQVMFIPMKGRKESLNVSVAAGIALYVLQS